MESTRFRPDRPALTPQFCFSSSALRDFLRLSRSATDDSISQNLNALVTPSREGFDTRVEARRYPSARRIDGRPYLDFKENVLFPSWQARSDVISYCTMVTTSPDPDDPEAAVREAELAHDKERVVNERLDPYSARFSPREPRTERLAALLRQERGVESIVRARTWGVIKERCAEPAEAWEGAFRAWQRQAALQLQQQRTRQEALARGIADSK